MSEPDLYVLAGGKEGLRKVISSFYEAVFADVMIGFFFWDADKERLIDKEVELAASALGARDISYTGKPLREAHAKHPILGGHFERRLQLLKEAMEKHQLPAPVREAWVQHTRALRPLITRDEGSECDHARNNPPGVEPE